MLQTTVSFTVPQEILLSLNESKETFESQSKLYTALFLFKEHKLSIEKAAKLAGLDIYDFIKEAGKHKIDIIDYSVEDFEKELKVLDL